MAYIATHNRTVNMVGQLSQGKPLDQLNEHYSLLVIIARCVYSTCVCYSAGVCCTVCVCVCVQDLSLQHLICRCWLCAVGMYPSLHVLVKWLKTRPFEYFEYIYVIIQLSKNNPTKNIKFDDPVSKGMKKKLTRLAVQVSVSGLFR